MSLLVNRASMTMLVFDYAEALSRSDAARPAGSRSRQAQDREDIAYIWRRFRSC